MKELTPCRSVNGFLAHPGRMRSNFASGLLHPPNGYSGNSFIVEHNLNVGGIHQQSLKDSPRKSGTAEQQLKLHCGLRHVGGVLQHHRVPPKQRGYNHSKNLPERAVARHHGKQDAPSVAMTWCTGSHQSRRSHLQAMKPRPPRNSGSTQHTAAPLLATSESSYRSPSSAA